MDYSWKVGTRRFRRRKAVTFTAPTGHGKTLGNFGPRPWRVRIRRDEDIRPYVDSAGNGIAFGDGVGNALPHDIELVELWTYHDHLGSHPVVTMDAWTRTRIAHPDDTFYVYYDQVLEHNTDPASPDAASTWQDFTARYAGTAVPGIPGSELVGSLDSTSNAHHLVGSPGVTSITPFWDGTYRHIGAIPPYFDNPTALSDMLTSGIVYGGLGLWRMYTNNNVSMYAGYDGQATPVYWDLAPHTNNDLSRFAASFLVQVPYASSGTTWRTLFGIRYMREDASPGHLWLRMRLTSNVLRFQLYHNVGLWVQSTYVDVPFTPNPPLTAGEWRLSPWIPVVMYYNMIRRIRTDWRLPQNIDRTDLCVCAGGAVYNNTHSFYDISQMFLPNEDAAASHTVLGTGLIPSTAGLPAEGKLQLNVDEIRIWTPPENDPMWSLEWDDSPRLTADGQRMLQYEFDNLTVATNSDEESTTSYTTLGGEEVADGFVEYGTLEIPQTVSDTPPLSADFIVTVTSAAATAVAADIRGTVILPPAMIYTGILATADASAAIRDDIACLPHNATRGIAGWLVGNNRYYRRKLVHVTFEQSRKLLFSAWVDEPSRLVYAAKIPVCDDYSIGAYIGADGSRIQPVRVLNAVEQPVDDYHVTDIVTECNRTTFNLWVPIADDATPVGELTYYIYYDQVPAVEDNVGDEQETWRHHIARYSFDGHTDDSVSANHGQQTVAYYQDTQRRGCLLRDAFGDPEALYLGEPDGIPYLEGMQHLRVTFWLKLPADYTAADNEYRPIFWLGLPDWDVGGNLISLWVSLRQWDDGQLSFRAGTRGSGYYALSEVEVESPPKLTKNNAQQWMFLDLYWTIPLEGWRGYFLRVIGNDGSVATDNGILSWGFWPPSEINGGEVTVLGAGLRGYVDDEPPYVQLTEEVGHNGVIVADLRITTPPWDYSAVQWNWMYTHGTYYDGKRTCDDGTQVWYDEEVYDWSLSPATVTSAAVTPLAVPEINTGDAFQFLYDNFSDAPVLYGIIVDTGNLQPATSTASAVAFHGTLATYGTLELPAVTVTAVGVSGSVTLLKLPFADPGIGREPIAVGQQRGLGYPMLQPSADIKHLLADFYLQFRTPRIAAYPLSIRWLYGMGDNDNDNPEWAPEPEHAADILIVDADGNTVFDSTEAAYAVRNWTHKLRIHQWTTSVAVCRLVQHTAWPPDELWPPERDYDLYLVPDDGRLDPRTTVQTVNHVLSLEVDGEQLTGDIVLEQGYNTSFATAVTAASSVASAGQVFNILPPSIRRQQLLVVDAVPGSGLGRAPYEGDDETPIIRINGIGGDEFGNFSLSAVGCYYVRQPSEVVSETGPRLVALEPHALEVGADCPPCCDCPEFVEVKLAIDRQWNLWKTLGSTAEGIRDTYADNRNRWLLQKECREAHPQRLDIVFRGEGNVAVTYVFCHMAQECTGPLVVDFLIEGFRTLPDGTLEEFDLQPSLVPSKTVKNEGSRDDKMHQYLPDGELPEITAYWEQLDSHRTAKLHLSLLLCAPQDGDSIKVTATPRFGGELLEAVTKVAAVPPAVTIPDPRCL